MASRKESGSSSRSWTERNSGFSSGGKSGSSPGSPGGKSGSSPGSTGGRSGSSAGSLVRVGRVGKPHGNEGFFAVGEPTERLQLLDPGRDVEIGGAVRTVAARKGTAERPLLKLEGTDDRSAAEGLHRQEILVPREALGLEEGEYLVDDLVGCTVVADGRAIGHVADVLLLPAADVLEVAREGAGPLLVPLVRDAIRSVDPAARTIDVEMGFLDAD